MKNEVQKPLEGIPCDCPLWQKRLGETKAPSELHLELVTLGSWGTSGRAGALFWCLLFGTVAGPGT